MELQVHLTDDRLCIGLWQNMALVDVAGRVDATSMLAIGDAYRQLARSYTRVAGFCVVRPSAPLATAESQQEAARFSRELGPTLAHVAVVIEADGVVAQMFRSTLRAFSVFSRNPPLSVTSAIIEGARASAPFVQSALPPEHIARELSEAFARLRKGYVPAG